MNSNHIECKGEIFTVTDYNGIRVIMDEEGYYNASKICADNDMKYRDIARNQYWSDYIDELTRGGRIDTAHITNDYVPPQF